MSRLAIALAAVLTLATAGPALAIDPGVASGHYLAEDLKVPKLAHAVALSLDNAEGQLDHPTELRILLSEEEVPPAALAGLHFTPAHFMAQSGALHGLLLRLDPTDRNSVYVTVLAKPDDPRQSFTTLTLSNTEGVWKRLEVNATRAAGELKANDTFDVAASFSSPVFTNPVQQDLKGPAAQASEPVKVLIARYEALAKGDMVAAAALSTKGAAERMAALPPEVMRGARAELPGLVKQLRAAKRVVIRRDTAAVDVGDGWYGLALENGAWKASD
jgi:hypothetical protein